MWPNRPFPRGSIPGVGRSHNWRASASGTLASMKLPKARGSGRQVGAGQFGEVDPDLGPDLGLPFDLQATRQPGGGVDEVGASRRVDGLGNAANGQQGRQAAVRWETRGSGGWAQRRCGTPWTPEGSRRYHRMVRLGAFRA